MKAVFIIYNQAYYQELTNLLKDHSCKGFTKWNNISGEGSRDGEPHEGSHAWPVMNDAVLAMVDDDKVDDIVADVKAKDEATPALGLRAFVWNIEKNC
ncbi:MAG: hypothetical protein MJY62_01955 [Bacteroidales bacterium]|nr:hypothetical protein [Bacteroidales bacterium]